jgi:hypothetical protein
MNESVDQLLDYEPPQIVTYSQEDILEELGPAQTLNGSNPVKSAY